VRVRKRGSRFLLQSRMKNPGKPFKKKTGLNGGEARFCSGRQDRAEGSYVGSGKGKGRQHEKKGDRG